MEKKPPYRHDDGAADVLVKECPYSCTVGYLALTEFLS
jgi:hypothetical protein